MAGFEILEGPDGVPVTAKGTADGFMRVVIEYMMPQSTGGSNIAPKTVPTGTAEPIIGSSTPVTRYVRVTSHFGNTKTVYVGWAGLTTTNGQPLGPGDTYTNRDIDNANLLYCISADAAQVLRIEVL